MDNFLLDVQLMSAHEKLDNWFYNNFKPTPKQSKEFFKLRRIEDLIEQSFLSGFEIFDFITMHKAGKLCLNDYQIFEELKDVNPKDWNK